MFNYEVAINYWEVFLLILVRVASFIYTAPFFGLGGVPQRTKLGLAFFISAIIYTLVPDRALEYSSVIDFAIIINVLFQFLLSPVLNPPNVKFNEALAV